MAAWATGGAIIGGGLFYNLTMPTISRLYPSERAKALSVLTLLGALASPIFYPLAGWMIDLWGWRGALQGLVLAMVLCVAPAAILVRAQPATTTPHRSPGASLRQALAAPESQRLFLVLALVGVASSSFILQQVPAMQAAGLSLTTAASFAGIRGAFQIPGRLLLTPLTKQLGVRGTIVACYAIAATTAIALLMAIQGVSAYWMAAYFCVLGGMSLGLLSPLNGLFQAEVFGDERLGTLSGVAVVVGSIAGAAGGFISGLFVDITGGYGATLVLASGLYGLAILCLIWQGSARRAVHPAYGEETIGAEGDSVA
jgi:predicted MFS family arabinose efflux permease